MPGSFTNALIVSNCDAPVDNAILAEPFSAIHFLNISAVSFAALSPSFSEFSQILISI